MSVKPDAGAPVLDALFAPRWAGGWTFARLLFGVAALELHKDRFFHVRDALAHPEVVFNAGPAHVVDHVAVGAAGAWGLWGLGLVGIGALLYGGRWARPGLWSWFVAYALLVAALGLNVRVPERFIVWATLALSVGPIGQRGLLSAYASPFGRYLLLVVYGSLYLSTGVMKALEEDAWWDGSALAYALLDRWHGEGALAAWLSGQRALCAFGSAYTIVFEVAFVFLVGLRRLSLPILLMGVGMHVGIDVLLEVGPLGVMAMALYPVLLDPGVGQRLWTHARPGLGRFASWLERQ